MAKVNKFQFKYNIGGVNMELKINIEFPERFLSALENLGKVYAVVQPEKIGAPMKEAIEKVEAVQEIEEVKEEEKKAVVPTSEVAYSFPQLQKAAAELARAGKRDELKDIINSFGVPAITDIPEDKYNEFALKIREAGGVI